MTQVFDEETLRCYKTMPEWNAQTLPKGFTRAHNTQAGTWAKIRILAGKLTFHALSETGQVLATTVLDPKSDTSLVAPQAWHRVEPASDDLRMQLSFYCRAEDYYVKKYRLSATHSEVVEVVKHIRSGQALDIGCARGRNALYLQDQGFSVDAFDRNEQALAQLQTIIDQEGITGIRPFVANAESFEASERYDLVINTVVMMFMSAASIPRLINTMQTATLEGGYNLVVCAIDSEDYPFSNHQLPFGFGFKEQELRGYYQGWKLHKYNEKVGHLHRLGSDGKAIALRFATMIAQKI